MKEKFINLLRSTKREGIEKLIDWLETTDFYDAPASTKYHLSEEHGLLKHSLHVFEELKEMYKEYPGDSIIICALLHDLCKANFYTVSEKNVKINGSWEKVPYYAIDDQFPIGHGEKSVIIIQHFIKLSDEEIAAIRWHMGAFDCNNVNTLSLAFEKYKLALFLHIADLRATYIREA